MMWNRQSKGGKTVIMPCENQYLPPYTPQLIRFTVACRKGVGGKCYLREMQKMNSKTISTYNNGGKVENGENKVGSSITNKRSVRNEFILRASTT
jgi:hypothetical protein